MKSNKPLNILLISKTLPWQFKGGIQTHTWELAKSLVAIGHKVSILNGGPFRSKTNTKAIEGISVIQTPYFPGRYIKPISLIAEEFSFNWAALFWVRKNHFQFDIIHAQGRSGYLLSFYSRIKSRLINTVHGLIDIENQDKKWYHLNNSIHHTFTKRIEDRLYNNATGLVAVSNALKEELFERRDVKKHVHVISNGVNSLSFEGTVPNTHQSKFLFIGRLHPVKGITKLVEKMHLANESIQLDIIGNGGEREKIEKLIVLKGLQNRVRLLGEYSNEKIHSVLPYYTALVLPSKYETQGIVLLEANSEGIPVIASDIPAIRETIVHGENGILCSKNRPEEFIQAMNHLAANREVGKAMGLKGKIKVESDYSWKKIAEKTESLYYTIAQ